MKAESRSALYEGRVMHCRLKPRQHRLAYRVFWLLLDLDEIDGLPARLKLFSRNRFNLFSFRDRDFGAGSDEPLRAQVERHLANAGLDARGGRIQLLTMPRVLGYAFNPLTVYFCYRRDGDLAAILYEVSNTFGERHSYLIPVRDDAQNVIRQECAKEFYVSPFMDMAMRYVFRVSPPGEQVRVSIVGRDDEDTVITAALSAHRKKLSDLALLSAFARYPFLTLKVVGAIHWEAARLWLKGMRPRRRPPAPEQPVSLVLSRHAAYRTKA
jgi:DUF1365 family protein